MSAHLTVKKQDILDWVRTINAKSEATAKILGLKTLWVIAEQPPGYLKVEIRASASTDHSDLAVPLARYGSVATIWFWNTSEAVEERVVFQSAQVSADTCVVHHPQRNEGWVSSASRWTLGDDAVDKGMEGRRAEKSTEEGLVLGTLREFLRHVQSVQCAPARPEPPALT